jgi:hypothetical protein
VLKTGGEGHVTYIPLFNREELAVAFAFILSVDEAQRLAAQWFERNTGRDDLDSAGYFLCEKWSTKEIAGRELTTKSKPERKRAQPTKKSPSTPAVLPPQTNAEFLLGWSNLHRDLLSLVSPQLSKRVQQVTSYTDEQAHQGRENALETAQDMKNGRYWFRPKR